MIFLIILVILAIVFIAVGVCTVSQNTVLVLTVFGKFTRLLHAGLNIKLPWEKRYITCTLQNQAQEVMFQAVTHDQATISFNALILYAVKDSEPETIKKAVFTFASKSQFMLALTKLIEGEVRTIVAEKLQQDILGIREHLSEEVKTRIEAKVSDWGYKLLDLQVTDMNFDEQVKISMDQVVAAANKKRAAENEGEALLIQQTKKAEAEGRALKIQAEAERDAWRMKGEGLAKFREEVSKGIASSAELLKEKGIDERLLVQLMYMETLKDVAKEGQGKIIFIDGGPNGANRMMEELSTLNGEMMKSNQAQ